MAYFGLLLLIFTIFGPIFFNQSVRIDRMQRDIKANRIVTTVEREINMAVRFGDGYSRNFTLPEDIDGQDYNLNIHDDLRLLEIKWADERKTRQILVNDSQGNLTPGENRIKNSDGKIVFD